MQCTLLIAYKPNSYWNSVRFDCLYYKEMCTGTFKRIGLPCNIQLDYASSSQGLWRGCCVRPARCVFLQHGSVQPKPRGLNTQISLKKRPFLSLTLLVRPYYWKRDGKKKSMGCLAESSEGVRLVQEDLDRLLLSTIADRQHTVPLRCPIWSAAAHGSFFGAFFYCAFHVREPCMS